MYVLLALALAAQPPKCDRNGAQIELNVCANEDEAEADKGLNAVWLRVQDWMQASDREAAKYKQDKPPLGFFGQALEAQRAWLAFRDSQCMMEGNEYYGGSIRPMIVSGCRERLTRERTKQLAEMIRPKH